MDLCAVRRRQQAPNRAGARDEIADAQVLVVRMLVVVRVHRRNEDERQVERVDEHVRRHRPTHHADAHELGWSRVWRTACCKRADCPPADGRIHRHPLGGLHRSQLEARKLVVAGSIFVRRRSVDEVIALRFNVVPDELEEPPPVSLRRRP